MTFDGAHESQASHTASSCSKATVAGVMQSRLLHIRTPDRLMTMLQGIQGSRTRSPHATPGTLRLGFGLFGSACMGLGVVQKIPMILIARYDCFVSGLATNSVDYQVKTYDVLENTDVDAMLRSEPIQRYKNSDGEQVEWRFIEIMAIDWNPTFESGMEVIGFITGRPVPALE